MLQERSGLGDVDPSLPQIDGQKRILNRVVSQLKENGSHKQIKYGTNEDTSDNVCFILAHAELSERTQSTIHVTQQKIQDVRSQYAGKRDEIRNSNYSSGKKQQLFQFNNTNESEEIHTIELRNTKARKSAEELYQISILELPFTDQSLPEILDEIRTLSPENSQRLSDYIDNLFEYCQQTKDTSFLEKVTYIDTPTLPRSVDDIQKLVTLLRFKFRSDTLSQSQLTIDQTRKVADAYLSLLRKSVVLKSKSAKEPYPISRYLHDVMAAAFDIKDIEIIKNIKEVLDPYLAEVISSKDGQSEINKLCANYWDKANKIYKFVFDKKSLGQKSPQVTEFPIEMGAAFSSDEYRLVSALIMLTNKTATESTLGGALQNCSASLQISGVMIASQLDRYKSKIQGNRTNILDDAHLASYCVYNPYNFADGITYDLTSVIAAQISSLSTGIPDDGIPVSRNSFEDSQKIISEFVSGGAVFTPKQQSSFLIHSAAHYFRKDLERKETSIENTILWHKILNEPEWFVSPRGDNFDIKNDPILDQYHIKSIKFVTDRNRPREHRVIISYPVMSTSMNVELWLTTDRKILSVDGRDFMQDIAIKDALLNLLLKRLYFISGGFLKELKEATTKDPAKPIHNLDLYKRAHYRILESTERRPITMQSQTAINHANLILDKYGIDIYAEMHRRKEVINPPTLLSNQFLTFVDEVIPDQILKNPTANELIYEPALMPLLV
jgi:hypothetical protein